MRVSAADVPLRILATSAPGKESLAATSPRLGFDGVRALGGLGFRASRNGTTESR